MCSVLTEVDTFDLIADVHSCNITGTNLNTFRYALGKAMTF